MPLYVAASENFASADTHGESKPWWETPYGRWRLSAETQAMQRFPQFTPHQSEEGDLCWVGRLRSGLPAGERYLVNVTYPTRFPDQAPEVRIEEPEISSSTPHLLSGGRPCLYHGGPDRGYDPARTTAATLVAWTALWIHAYETWRETGDWPGKEE